MTGTITPRDATTQASAALTAAGPATIGGPVSIESKPATLRGAALILTTAVAAGPGVDLAAVARVLSRLPGTATWGRADRRAYVYRHPAS